MDGHGHLQEVHGQKRRADDDLNNEQRLSKRFNLLNLDHNGKFYMPVQSNGSTRSPSQNDSMHLDDTKDKVYIHNLAAELSEIESDEDKPLFLPDIEKKLSKIPRSVLIGRNPPVTNTQMVLYNVPSSLSVPKEHDNVRRAIIDSRARSMEKQAHVQHAAQEEGMGSTQIGSKTGPVQNVNDDIAGTDDMEVDDNAMDIE
ncbi:MAG: hypothetical protein Q9174_001845 [Haloplaca sp. 1 TL-2023]